MVYNLSLTVNAQNADEKIEWIEYDKFEKINYIMKGGFGKVYKAFWKDGPIEYWDYETNQWNRSKYLKSVALKSLNSKDTSLEFLNEVEVIIVAVAVDKIAAGVVEVVVAVAVAVSVDRVAAGNYRIIL
ncbi:hypothetical protein C1645_823593 [Glomus cerebriforme]|uniref:Protein kinase domain-containing protein n=1 Tax=Glomus cerebriforme TaxID=658196 RepID=A0A397T049_9GLOM|nr:hypothetical protein C1645_823593 [Glomus cerebriforme]